MKKIEAIIKPFKLDELKEELVDLGVDGVTVTEVRGVHPHPARSARSFEPDFQPRMKIEIVVPDEQVLDVIDILRRICGAAQTAGEEILVIPVSQSVRVRTSEGDSRFRS